MRFFALSLFALAALASTAGCAAPTDDDAESSEAELGASTKVDIRVAAFIPCGALSSPEPRFSRYYEGDNRGFSHALAATRSRAAFDGFIDTKGTYSLTPIIGESRAYNRSETAGKNGLCYSLVPNPSIARRAIADASRMQSSVTKIGNQTRVTLGLHATNPLAWFSPALDADFAITIEQDAKGIPVAYWVDGEHDGFPAYELYLNGKPVYTYDGIAKGHDPFYLDDSKSRPRERVWISRRAVPTK